MPCVFQLNNNTCTSLCKILNGTNYVQMLTFESDKYHSIFLSNEVHVCLIPQKADEINFLLSQCLIVKIKTVKCMLSVLTKLSLILAQDWFWSSNHFELQDLRSCGSCLPNASPAAHIITHFRGRYKRRVMQWAVP